MTDRKRENFAKRSAENWQPPPCTSPGPVRRFFDLAAGSIWNDVAGQLSGARGSLLDVGCGAQPYRVLVPAQVHYQAIDYSGAKENFGYYAPDTSYYSGDAWPVADDSVDTILSTETLEHVLDTRQFLREAYRCLKLGGRLIITTPFSARWHFIPHDYWRFTPSCYQHLLQDAGFDDITVYPRGNALTVACYKNMALVLPLLLPQKGMNWRSGLRMLLGALLLPWFGCCACAGNLSLHFAGGDDCLGYTVLARKASR